MREKREEEAKLMGKFTNDVILQLMYFYVSFVYVIFYEYIYIIF